MERLGAGSAIAMVVGRGLRDGHASVRRLGAYARVDERGISNLNPRDCLSTWGAPLFLSTSWIGTFIAL